MQKAIAEEMVGASERQLGLAQDRLRVGSGDEYDVALAQREPRDLPRQRAQPRPRATSRRCARSRRSPGRYPAAAMSVPAQLAAMPGPVPAGMPSELLERRPDVVAAERRVAAAFYRVEEAKAARLPRISLTAAVTSISSELFVLKERDNPVWSVGASLLAPLFLGGQLQAQVEIRTAEQKQAIAEYGRVGARAFGEVENALSAGFALEEREAILTQAVADNARALELANVRYRVGVGRPARGPAAEPRAVCGAHRAAARAEPSASCSA